MTFEESQYLWSLLIVPLFAFLSIRSSRKSYKWLYFFTRKERRSGRYALHTLLLCGTMVAVIGALAQPWVQYKEIYLNRDRVEIIIGIDVSKSMLAEDVILPRYDRLLSRIPNRLNRARSFAITLLSRLQGERVGSFIFASKGVEIIPFTQDYGLFRYIVRHINETEITLPGSDLGEAITTAVSMFTVASRLRQHSQENQEAFVKALVLLSDGEDAGIDRSTLYESVRRASEQAVRIYTVGIGTGKGALIPIRSADGSFMGDYYRDEDGDYLSTRYEPDSLKEIARLTGGQYFRITGEGVEKQLMAAIISAAKTSGQTKSVELVWLDISPFFLLVGLALFLLAISAF